MPAPPFTRVHVITNPASGAGDGLPADVAARLDAAGLAWVRHDCGDAAGPDMLARRALDAGADLVVAHGGDGTVRAVAGVLAGTGVALGLLPAGTANVFAAEAAVPAGALAASALVTGEAPARVRPVDVGIAEVDGRAHPFLLRLGLGIEATMVTAARPEDKARWGRLAYALSFGREWRRLRPHRYRVAVGGGPARRTNGVACVVCNSVNPGLPGVSLLGRADASDGLLDVVVARSLGPRALGSAAWHALAAWRRGDGPDVRLSPAVRVWSGRAVRVSVAPAQEAACDGEPLGRVRRVRAEVRPGALRVLVPA